MKFVCILYSNHWATLKKISNFGWFKKEESQLTTSELLPLAGLEELHICNEFKDVSICICFSGPQNWLDSTRLYESVYEQENRF